MDTHHSPTQVGRHFEARYTGMIALLRLCVAEEMVQPAVLDVWDGAVGVLVTLP